MVQLDVARRRAVSSLADDYARPLGIDWEDASSGRRKKRMCAQARRRIQGARRCDQNVLVLYLKIRQLMPKAIADDVELPRLWFPTCHVSSQWQHCLCSCPSAVQLS